MSETTFSMTFNLKYLRRRKNVAFNDQDSALQSVPTILSDGVKDALEEWPKVVNEFKKVLEDGGILRIVFEVELRPEDGRVALEYTSHSECEFIAEDEGDEDE